ncbi:MAG: hypothetical protein HQL73_06310 [Magnetococcales bacterium]|nr:hypothetical protein [Magnetococcales bacterium]
MSQTTIQKQLKYFPEEWRNFIDQAVAEWKIESIIYRRELAGKSGASIWVVDIKSGSYNGSAILKVSNDKDAQREIDCHKKILNNNLIKERIPDLRNTFEHDKKFAMLMTIVGNAINEVEPLARCRNPDQQAHLQKIAEFLLKNLNNNPNFPNQLVPENQILLDWLGSKRCSNTSRIVDVLKDIFRLDSTCSSFRFDGTDFPNPLTLCQNTQQYGFRGIVPAYGFIHGDLHENNIIVRGHNYKFFQYLIDFAFYSEEKPIFFDHAYLELSLLLRSRENASMKRWMALVQSLVELQQPQDAFRCAIEMDDQGLLRSVGLIRASVLNWIEATQPNRKDDLKSQWQLAKVAAGVNYASKNLQRDNQKIANKLKAFAFLYAAMSARELFEYRRIDLPQDGPVANVTFEIPEPKGDCWRKVWNACNGFNHRQADYVLIASMDVSKLSEAARHALGKVPWSVVFEFHTSPLMSLLYESCQQLLRLHKTLHHIFPSQLKSISLDFTSALCWVMAEGNIGTNGELVAQSWRHQILQPIQSLGEQLRRVNTLRPIYILVLGDGIDPVKLRHTIDRLDESMKPLQILLVRPPAAAETPLEDFRIDSPHQEISCHWQDLAYGIDQMFGDQEMGSKSKVPVRDEQLGDIRMEYLPEETANEVSECLEVIHSGLAKRNVEEETSDFLYGNTITWRELDLNRDVNRSETPRVIDAVRTIIAERREKSYTIEHTPGAGGSTLARRIAWSLCGEFPSVSLTSYIEKRTAESVERLFQFTHLPVLVVVEECILSGARRDLFFNELKSRSISFLILDVRRRFQPRNTPTSHALADPMNATDAQRFLEVYREKAPPNRHAALRQLATHRDYLQFRSAFFFGLYAFGKEFRRVPDYVDAHLKNAPEKIKDALAQLALISRYSQEWLPIEAFIYLMGIQRQIGQLPHQWRSVLDSASDLVAIEGQKASIAHPLLAEEVLRQVLTGSEKWVANLADFCIRFINKFAEDALQKSEFANIILSRIFLSRERLSGTVERRSLFSELINLLPTEHAGRRVMETLCRCFEENDHFWNHLGRLINFKFNERELAKQHFNKAISINENEEEHHHGLGMVFRFEVNDLLNIHLNQDDKYEDRFKKVQPIFELAYECFQKARQINPSSTYALFTPIQMAHHTLERLVSLRGVENAGEFLKLDEEASQWGREILERSEGLLERFRNIEAGSDDSEQQKKCSAWVQGMQGDVDGMIHTYTMLLARAQITRKPSLRRTLARAYLRHKLSQTETPSIDDYRKTAQLMTENLVTDPNCGSDLLLWLRAARMLPEFTLTEALERFGFWAATGKEGADFYLYVLNFLNQRTIKTDNRNTILTHIENSKRKGSALVSKNSIEWLAAKTLKRPCPLVHYSELGGWDNETRFVRNVKMLAWVEGRIDDSSSPQSGTIDIDGIPAFFVPRPSQKSTHLEQFWSSDINTPVQFHLGFSYEGLRAWRVKRKQ